MKKILIIFVLILSCNFAFGAGVSCWEEYTTSNKTEPATSALRTALINAGITPILVSKMYELTAIVPTQYGAYHGTTTNFYTGKMPFELIELVQHSQKTGLYMPSKYYYTTTYATNSSGNLGQQTNNYYLFWNGNVLGNYYNNQYTMSFGYSIYTYCIIDSGSGGGGGGSILSAPVNFLIKATS